MCITKRSDNKKSEYELFKDDFKKTVSEHETELIKLIKRVSTTYSDVENELRSIKREVIWKNDKGLLVVVENVERHFENEKGGLSINKPPTQIK